MTVVYTRTGLGFTRLPSSGFAWDITDLTNTDPSGNGTTQIGDFARYTNPTTSAVEVYRLRAVTIDSAIGGGTLTTWVPASIYGEAALTIRAYLIGTETMVPSGSTLQGYTVTASGASASVTTSGGEVVLTSTTLNHFASLQSTYALQPTDRFYVRQNLRIDQTSGGGGSRTFYQLLYSAGATQPQFITTQNPTTNSGHFVPSNTSLTFFGSTLMIRGGGSAIGNTAELVEFLADGTSLSDMVSVARNARPYFSMRRNAQVGAPSPVTVGQHLIQTFQNVTAAQTARLSHLYFMTY